MTPPTIIGGHMGVRTFVTEAGHYRPEKPEAVELIKLAAQRTPHAPFILEYVGPADFRQALEHLRENLNRAMK